VIWVLHAAVWTDYASHSSRLENQHHNCIDSGQNKATMCLRGERRLREPLYCRRIFKRGVLLCGRLVVAASNFDRILQHLEPEIHIPMSRTDKTMLDREVTGFSVTLS
jgi:hypothetical protein